MTDSTVNGGLFAAVALPLPLNKAFHYKVPAHLVEAIAIGSRVMVEFSGRRLVGFALSLDSEAGVGGDKVKELVELIDPEPCLDAGLIELARWISDYYHHPVGEVLFAMVPPSARGAERITYSATAVEPPEGAPPSALKLYGRASAAKTLALGALPVGSGADVEYLLNAGSLLRKVEDSAAHGGRGVRWAALAEDAPQPELAGKTGVKLAELLTLLSGRPLKVSELLADGIGRDTIKRAEARGWVVLSEEARGAVEGATLGFGGEVENEPTPEQAQCLEKLDAALSAREFSPFLLMGVTGSGKTEVYLRAAVAALEKGFGALVLVPEIGLTPQLLGRFSSRLGERLAVLHSGLSERERGLQWEAVRSGAALVAVGTRSAVFAPVKNLGLIIVDEEHEGSYKQEDGLRYNAKHVALMRAKKLGAALLAGSATPDVESYHHAQAGRYGLLRLPGRVGGADRPEIRLVDLRQEEARRAKRVFVGEELKKAVDECLARGEQALVFINRRGFSPSLTCLACGEPAGCVNCSVPMTLHRGRAGAKLVCHYCGAAKRVPPVCPACGSQELLELGAGTQKLEELVAGSWPDARVLRLDRDSAGGMNLKSVLESFASGNADILVGTQMVAKGHHFPRLTVVGVVNADDSLNVPDFRAAERTFQLLTQVAGRAGRVAEMPGRVLIQTRNPHHPALLAVKSGDYEDFAADELSQRERAGFPPFARLALLRVSATDPGAAAQAAKEAAETLDKLPSRRFVDLLGPAPAPIEKVKARYRHQILLRAEISRTQRLHALLNEFIAAFVKRKGGDVRISIDVDPVTLT